MKTIVYNVIIPRLDKSGPSMLSYDIAEKMHDDGHIVNYFYLSSGGSSSNIPFSCNKIKKFSYWDFFRISGVVHSHAFRPDLINALLSLKPKIITLTTIPSYFYRDVIFDYSKWKALLAWTIWRFAIRNIKIKVCISDRMTRYYKRLIPNTEFKTGNNFRIERMGSLNDAPITEIIKIWIAKQRASGRFVMVFAAGLRPRKNIMRLIDEIGCHKEIALLIIGDGPQRDLVIKKIDEINRENQFLYCGMIDSPREVFKICDFLVLPSFAEGVPNVVLEAASVGTLSILSKIGIHRDLENKGLALTFNHWDFSDFIEKVKIASKNISESNKIRIVDTWKTHYSGDLTMKIYKDEIQKYELDINFKV